MDISIFIGAISCLASAVVSVWVSYLVLQNNKDKAVDQERSRSDRLIKEAQDRFDRLSKESRESLDKEHQEMIFFIVSHYERMFKVLQSQHGISKTTLAEETKKTTKLDRLSQSDITEISSEMRLLLEKKPEHKSLECEG